mmetsp:Transcript_33360/g.83166  ORF Transcript_33360/g.83166 Transcript_33360/m.83166 type:complete len:96 (+) Transcript_33360:32-319(+)
MTLRIAIQEDLPQPGSVTYVMTSWDVEADAPATIGMAMTRLATLEPVGNGQTQLRTIDKSIAAVPEWVSSMWVSNVMSKQIKADTMRYKKVKGMA